MLLEKTKGVRSARWPGAVPVARTAARQQGGEGLLTQGGRQESSSFEQKGHPVRSDDAAERQEALGSNPNSATC